MLFRSPLGSVVPNGAVEIEMVEMRHYQCCGMVRAANRFEGLKVEEKMLNCLDQPWTVRLYIYTAI